MTIILLFAFIGFAVSWHIFYKKRRNEKLVCFIGENCNKVVRSEYSALLGAPNEILGMAYYGAVIIGATLLMLGWKTVFGFSLWGFLVFFGGAAAAFSVIFLFIQAFLIKEWCEYCLVSAGMSLAIFIAELLRI